jgi:hypothetical protein
MKCQICFAINHLAVTCYVCGHDMTTKFVRGEKSTGRMAVRYKYVARKPSTDEDSP